MTQGWKHFMHMFVQSSPSQTSKDCHPEKRVPKTDDSSQQYYL